jgi:hypothetical protein
MTKPTPPVPPRELRAQWINDCPILSPGATGGPMLRIGTDWTIVNNKAAAWGWEQAISDSKPFILHALTDNGGVILGPAEREELAGLLMELRHELYEAYHEYGPDVCGCSELIDRAEKTAMRLKGVE